MVTRTIHPLRWVCIWLGAVLALALLPGVWETAQAAHGDTAISLVKGDRKAIVSITVDDGNVFGAEYYITMFERDGYKGTMNVIVDGFNPLIWHDDDWYYSGSWSTWADWAAQGKIEVGTHTYTHSDLTEAPPIGSRGTYPDAPPYPYTAETTTEEFLENEINTARSIIDANIPSQRDIVMAFPFDSWNSTILAKAAENHYASRGGVLGYNDLDGLTDLNFMTLKQQDVACLEGYPSDCATLTKMNGWVDSAIANGKWLVEMWHACDPDGPGWAPVDCSDLDSHSAYLATNSDQVWTAALGEAVRYIRERQTSTLNVLEATASTVRISLTDTMDDAIFDYPLTLKTELSTGFLGGIQAVWVNQNGVDTLVIPVYESGIYYAVFSAVPDQGEITLSPSREVESQTGAHGTIAPLGVTEVKVGDDLVFQTTPDVGYHLSGLTLNGTPVTTDAEGRYTLADIQQNYTLAASFAINVYDVTSGAQGGGAIDPDGATPVEHGQPIVFGLTPGVGHFLDQVLLDGNPVDPTPTTSYEINPVTQAHSVTAVFAPLPFDVTSAAEGNGQIDPNGANVFHYGDTVDFTLTPDEGHHVDEFYLDGNPVYPVPESSYQISPLTQAHSVTAVYAINTYNVVASVNGNHGGSVDPEGALVKDWGSSQVFHFIPAPGFRLNSVDLDGQRAVLSPDGTLVLENITQDHSVAANFTLAALPWLQLLVLH